MKTFDITRTLVLIVIPVFTLTHLCLGLTSLKSLTTSIYTLIAMVICLGASLLLVQPLARSRPIRRSQAWAVIASTTLIALLVNAGLAPDFHPGYAAWHSGAIQMLLVGVCLLGHQSIAWVGYGLFATAQFIGWRLLQLSYLDIVINLVTPLLWLASASTIHWFFERNKYQIQVSQSRQEELFQQQAAEYAQSLRQEEWSALMNGRVWQAFDEIENLSGRITPDLRKKYQLLEIELRDEVRARSLMTKQVRSAVREARARGVSVDLSDMRNAPFKVSTQKAITEFLVKTLTEASPSSHIDVLARPATMPPAVVILVRLGDGSSPVRTDIHEDQGNPINR